MGRGTISLACVAMALTGEVGELVEVLQWLTPEEADLAGADPELRARLEDELADVLIYLASLAKVLDVDLIEVALTKCLGSQRPSSTDEVWVAETGVVDDDVGLRHGIRLRDVEAFRGGVALSVESFGSRPAFACAVPGGDATQGQLRVDVEPDPQVPVAVKFRAESKHAVDDQDSVVR